MKLVDSVRILLTMVTNKEHATLCYKTITKNIAAFISLILLDDQKPNSTQSYDPLTHSYERLQGPSASLLEGAGERKHCRLLNGAQCHSVCRGGPMTSSEN